MDTRHRHRLLGPVGLAGLVALLVLAAGPALALLPGDLLDQRDCGIGALSPDGRLLVFTVSAYDRDGDATRTTVHLRDLVTGAQQVLFTPDDRAAGFVFAPDGATVAFTRETADGTEVWLMAPDGTDRRRVAGPGFFGSLHWSPDSALLAHVVSDSAADYEGIPGRVTVAEDLGWRHLGQGERAGRLRQLHLLDPGTGQDRVVPLAGRDVREQAWSPDGSRLVVSAKARGDLGRILNTELWVVPREGSGARRLSRNPGPDTRPRWIAAERIACLSHPDSLHESRPAQIVIRDLDGRERERLLGGFDNPIWGLWHHDGAFYVRGAWRGTAAIFRVQDEAWRQLTPAGWNVSDIRFGGGRAVLHASSLTCPGAIFDLDLASGELARLVDPNERWYDRVHLVEPRAFSVKLRDRSIDAWVFLPEDHLPGHPLPTVLSIHGGPEWMYGGYFLPEFHVLPQFGYAVIIANPTGSTGYGRAFMEEVRGDWIGRPAQELLAVIDHAVGEGWTDPELLAVMGGSYGGHLAAALTTQTDRFRAAAVDRMYPQTVAFWGATDEKWFPEWEFSGRPFDPGAREIYARNDPFGQVDRVTTPTLISQGLQDHRCPPDGAVGWFSALRSQGVPARLLRFHDEGHGIRGRANQVYYLEQLLAWFERWVLGAASHE
jgi:dipeptidyl aminopeptidase/acylaminoacyl peptidase